MISLSTLGTFSLVLSVVVAITQQRECYEWEYPCPNNDGCCNCLMCPGGSACTRTFDETEKACRTNIPQSFYPNCANIAHCGWGEQEATFPTCPPIPPQDDARVTYITPPTSFRYKRVENHLFAKARIVCADGTNSTVVMCLPGGTDGSGGRWNGSTSLVCNKNHGADVVSAPPNQIISSTPSMIASSDDLPTTPSVTAAENITSHGMQNNTSGNNITNLVLDNSDTYNVTSAKPAIPVYAICIIVVGAAALLGVTFIVWCYCHKNCQRNVQQEEPKDGGPEPGDPLLLPDACREGTTVVEMPDTDHNVSRNNNHASENGHCVANGWHHKAGAIPSRELVEATNRIPEQSNEESLRLECIEMQTAADNPTMMRNRDTQNKESIIPKVMPDNQNELSPVSLGNSRSSPQQAGRGPVENDVTSCQCPDATANPPSQPRTPEQQDDRIFCNIPGSQSSSSTGSSDSDNQACSSQTFTKELYDSGQGQIRQKVVEVNGSDEGLPSIDDLSKADPDNYRNDGQSFYTGPGIPEEVNTEITQQAVDTGEQADQLEFPVNGAASGQGPGADVAGVVMEEREHASGGPSDDNRNDDRAELDRGRVAQRHNQDLATQGNDISSTARSNGLSLYRGDPDGEHECNTTFVQASKHKNFQAFVPELAVYTDQPCALWRPFSSYVCGECRPQVLDNKEYIVPKKGDAMGIGGSIFYECATNLGRTKKLYRLIHFFAYYSGVPHRDSCLQLIKHSFEHHSATCRPCQAIFERFNIS